VIARDGDPALHPPWVAENRAGHRSLMGEGGMDIFSDEEQKNESEENWRPKLSHMLLQHTMGHNYSNVNMSTECEEGESSAVYGGIPSRTSGSFVKRQIATFTAVAEL
jgi:hypothetical protein